MRPVGRKDRSIDRFENVFVENPVLVIFYLWLFMWLLFNDAYLFWYPHFRCEDYILISVYCDKEVWSLSSDSRQIKIHVYRKRQTSDSS